MTCAGGADDLDDFAGAVFFAAIPHCSRCGASHCPKWRRWRKRRSGSLGWYTKSQMFKFCGRCQTEKPLAQFRKRGLSGHQAWCTPCYADYDRLRYQNIDNAEKIRKAVNKKARYDRQQCLVREIKEHAGCIDCGNTDHRVLDFDHVQGNKSHNVSEMIGVRAWSKILAEIDKCEIRCANCHRIKTQERRERGRR